MNLLYLLLLPGNLYVYHMPSWNQDSSTVHRLATGWTVLELNSGGGEIFRTRPDRL